MKIVISILILVVTLTNAVMPESDLFEKSPVSLILGLNISHNQDTYLKQTDLSASSQHEHSTDAFIYHSCHLGHCGFEIPMPFEKLKFEKSLDYFSMVKELTSSPSKLKKRPPKV